MAHGTGTRHAMTHESPFLRPAVVPDGVFGYGSLMNPATHDYADLRPARLEGWRRRWAHAEGRPAAFLTAERAPGLAIDGAVADVPPVAWPALDAREAAYDRHDVSEALTPPCGRVVVYAVPGARQGPPTARHPVLLSYLDAVIQGAMTLHGPAGATRFFDTTQGWGAVLDDRDAPRYPRAQRLSSAERAAVDEGLARLGLQRRPG